MGVDTILKIVFALLIVAVLVAALSGLAAVVASSTGSVGSTVAGLQRSADYTDASGSFTPGSAVGWMMAMVFPGPNPQAGFGWDASAVNAGWLWALLALFPVALTAWFVVKYLARYVLGGG